MLGTPVSTRAEGVANIDPDREDCSITLSLGKDKGTSKELKDGEISLYNVASVKVEDGYKFDVSSGKFADIAGVAEMISKEEFSDLAKKLEDPAAKVKEDSKEPITGDDITFEGLKPGLYLIVQNKLSKGDRKINSFLISIPDEDGKYQVNAEPKIGIYTPPTPETPPTPPGKPPKGKLPQTGQLWWPVPVMAIAGTVLIAAGLRAKRKQNA